MRNQKEKILFFTNELALLIKSGLTFTKAIEIILKEEKNKKFKDILKRIHKNLTIGKSIYDSFKPFENTFGSTYLYILKIGELSGNIVESLEDISKSLEFDLSRQKKLVGILIYPIIVISLTFLIVSFLLIYILPSFITIFEENQIQGATNLPRSLDIYHTGTETIHGKIKVLRYTLSSSPIRRAFFMPFSQTCENEQKKLIKV